jgi:HlyD family secretion protein
MLAKWIKRIAAIGVAVLVVGAALYALMPKPVPADIAVVDRGPLEVTIDEEGIARIRDVFRVSAPVAGRVERLPVEVGDRVYRGTSAVASLHPVDPSFLDLRARRELEAAVEAARAAVSLAEAEMNGTTAAERLAESDLLRAEKLAKVGAISERAFEKAATDVDTAKAQVEQAKATLALRQSELVSAEARLIEPDQEVAVPSRDACCMIVRAPEDGVVLTLLSQSEQVVPAGTPLLEIGDPKEMEIIVHLLSSDAANVKVAALARLDEWGGGTLAARIRRVDPAAYTKVSALGIEEQRVDAILDLVDPYEAWKKLGHDFRVMVHIVSWRGDDVVRVPLGALFRRGNDWSVYRLVNGRAVVTKIEIDHRNARSAEVVKGLAAGDAVVLHPSDRVADGVAIEKRAETPPG